jgi:hypothetical protein
MEEKRKVDQSTSMGSKPTKDCLTFQNVLKIHSEMN